MSQDSTRVSLVSGGGRPGQETSAPEEEGALSQTQSIATKVDEGGWTRRGFQPPWGPSVRQTRFQLHSRP